MSHDNQGGEGIAVLAGVMAGTSAGPVATFASGVIVETFLQGAVSFEMGFLVALFVAGLCGFVVTWPSALCGVFLRLFPGRAMGWIVGLSGSLLGSLLGGCVYFWIIAPQATVPPQNVFWVGVVSTLGTATAGGVAGTTSWLIVRSIDKRRLATPAD